MNFGKEFNVLWDIFFTEKKIVFAHVSDMRTSVGEENFSPASTASERLIHPGEDARQADTAGAHQ